MNKQEILNHLKMELLEQFEKFHIQTTINIKGDTLEIQIPYKDNSAAYCLPEYKAMMEYYKLEYAGVVRPSYDNLYIVKDVYIPQETLQQIQQQELKQHTQSTIQTIRVHYGVYKRNGYKAVPNTYDSTTKTILVEIPVSQ